MDFDFTPDQRHWHDEAVRFALAELTDPEDLLDRDARREFSRAGWRKCADFGAQGLIVPEAYGGKGQSLDVAAAMMEGLGYGCADSGLVFAINACLWTVTVPLLQFGTEDQKQRWLPGLCDGRIVGANGASEPEAGSDIFSMQTRAEKAPGGGWVLNGRKTWLTAGPVADLFVLYASTDPKRGILGLSAFLVPKDAPGVRLVREIPKLGLRTVPFGELALEDCRLPADALLGREGRGAELFNLSMEYERGLILAAALGTMRRNLERCIQHARTRTQFGKPIGKFQTVANRIVDMAVRLEQERPLDYRFAAKRAKGQDAAYEASLAKLAVSEAFLQNSLDAVRTFGATGYITETGLERDLRDSVGGVIFSGTNDIQRAILAQKLKL
jgi:alkylation response protein AidB-like acyl-CoA dehydrogenase